jgi:hypothetical protein
MRTSRYGSRRWSHMAKWLLRRSKHQVARLLLETVDAALEDAATDKLRSSTCRSSCAPVSMR